MVNYKQILREENEAVKERMELALERIREIPEEVSAASMPEVYQNYFRKTARYVQIIETQLNYDVYEHSMEELLENNRKLYGDVFEEAYGSSYANPAYAVAELGEDYGQLLSFLYAELYGLIIYAREYRLEELVIHLELFIEIYNMFQEYETLKPQQIQRCIYYFYYDYCDVMVPYRTREMYDSTLDYCTRIVEASDLTDLRYLYAYGDYISENEIKTAQYLNQLSEEEIRALAFTYTDGYREGFEIARIDLSKKKYVNIRYAIGQERIVRAAIAQFRELGLEPVIYKSAMSRINRRQIGRSGTLSTSPNRQFDYDHRMDEGIYMDKALQERKLEVLAQSYESYKDIIRLYAGPAVIETFGENPFEPTAKPECVSLSKKQQELSIEYTQSSSRIVNTYINREEYSFTIIAYPTPDIGENFEAIFRETVKVNTLDKVMYRKIQECLIEELNQAEYVLVEGTGANRTRMKVMMHEMEHPEQETNFENCLADVNIPVGEVFTSPKLTGTEGVLNVSEVFLNDLKFVDLTLHFQNGIITDYTCKNFTSEEENVRYVKENLLNNRDTLPIGEFAIGTNTTAYVMANAYDIVYKLPILIVEKMGPHFAVGDTCYSYSEENRLFNPDGKEIVAKDNEYSILRKEDISKAYFNCHTDITIPYDEIGSIRSVHPDGTEVELMRQGRFVLPGTEALNAPFKKHPQW
jgi:leucyl aminopeptidase (aminopeptidase T)